MPTSQDVLLTTSIVVRATPQNESPSNDPLTTKKAKSLLQMLEQHFGVDSHVTVVGYVTYTDLGDPDVNARPCDRCGSWATDQDREGQLTGLVLGNEVDGFFLCHSCL